MADGWKVFEARVAKRFGLRRRGASTSLRGEGLSDAVELDGSEPAHWSIECKLLGRPNYQQLLDACRQAEAAAASTACPIAVVKRKRDHDANALVVMRLETFLEWYGPSGGEPDGAEPERRPMGPVGAFPKYEPRR